MKKAFYIILALSSQALFSQPATEIAEPADLVNPLMGTQSQIQSVKRQYLSGHRPSMGNEFLGTPDRKNGRRVDLYL